MRNRPRLRVLVFCGLLAAITGLVQWKGLEGFLDGLAGLKWSAAVVSFLRTNTQGLIVIIVVTLFFEYIGFEGSRDDERRFSRASHELLDAALQSTTSRALVKRGLADEYGADAAQAFGEMLRHPSALLTDMTVRIEVLPSLTGGFLIQTRLQYKCDLAKFVIAFTSSPLQLEVLSSLAGVNEIFFVAPAEVDMLPGSVGAPARVSVLARRATGEPEVSRELPFARVSNRARAKLLEGSGVTEALDRFHLYESRPSRALGFSPQAGSARFSIDYRAESERDLPQTYWMADQPLHIREIEVDLRALGPERYERARVQLMIGRVGWAERASVGDGIWSFPLDTWLVTGQGISVVWPAASAQETRDQHPQSGPSTGVVS